MGDVHSGYGSMSMMNAPAFNEDCFQLPALAELTGIPDDAPLAGFDHPYGGLESAQLASNMSTFTTSALAPLHFPSTLPAHPMLLGDCQPYPPFPDPGSAPPPLLDEASSTQFCAAPTSVQGTPPIKPEELPGRRCGLRSGVGGRGGGWGVGVKAEDVSSRKSPTGHSDSSNSREETTKAASVSQPLDRKALAKQRYREKNRKAQARHRERNKKTIEDLTIKNTTLMGEMANLRLELSIASAVARAKDSHFSKLKKIKEDLSFAESVELMKETYMLNFGEEPSEEKMSRWSLQDSAGCRQVNIEKKAKALAAGVLDDPNSSECRTLMMQQMRMRNVSLEFAVGKPRLTRNLYAFERASCKDMPKPDFDALWRRAVARIGFTEEQRMQMVVARAHLLAKARLIFQERLNIICAAQAGTTEGLADLLASSLEEERQAVLAFLFTFFDETMTLVQDCICDAVTYPWTPDVLAFSDILMEEAVASKAGGVEALELPAHLLPTRDGHPEAELLTSPAVQQVAEMCSQTQMAGVAAGVGVPWPQETPLQLLSIPVVDNHCGTAGISILRNVLMFPGGSYPAKLPDAPLDVIFTYPILHMVKGPKQADALR